MNTSLTRNLKYEIILCPPFCLLLASYLGRALGSVSERSALTRANLFLFVSFKLTLCNVSIAERGPGVKVSAWYTDGCIPYVCSS